MTELSHADADRWSRHIAWRRGVGLLVMTLLVPGSAQLVAGGKGLGRFALKVWAIVWVALAGFVVLVLTNRTLAVTLYTHPATQWIASVLVLVLGAGWALLSGEFPKAMPPDRMVATDWVCIFRPSAPMETSMPLAFQKRVSGVTNLS